MDISNYGKGAIQTPPEVSDTRFRLAATPPPVIDWNTPYNVENGFVVPQLDQKSSSSCTAQASAYYGMALAHLDFEGDEDYSRRHIYSQVYIPPDGGAYIWKAMSIPVNQGYVIAQSVPDGDSSEQTMRDASLNGNAIQEALALKYAQIPRGSIDYMASLVTQYGGFVTGFNGHNGMFAPDGTVIDWSKSDWGHAVWVCGFQIRNGQKVLKFKNSWSAQWGDNGYGYFPESFLGSGYIFDAYTYADIADIDPMSINNRFVKVEGQKDVWLVRDNKRSLVYNALAFSLVSGEWDKIEKITLDQLNAIPDTGKVLAGLEQE